MLCKIMWDEEEEDEIIYNNDLIYQTEPIYDTEPEDEADSFYDTDPVYDTEDEGDPIEEEVVESQRSFLNSLILRTGEHDVTSELSGFFISHELDFLSKATQEITPRNIIVRESLPIIYIHVRCKFLKLFVIWKPWISGIMDEDSRLQKKNRGRFFSKEESMIRIQNNILIDDTDLGAKDVKNAELTLSTWHNDVAAGMTRFVGMLTWKVVCMEPLYRDELMDGAVTQL